MAILLSTLTLLLLTMLLQLLTFRIRLPRNQTLAIMKLYAFLLGTFVLVQALGIGDHFPSFKLSALGCLYASLAYLSVLPTHVILYTLVEAESPSNLMALSLVAAGEKGLPQSHFGKLVTNDLFVLNRVGALLSGGHISEVAGRYVITPKGDLYMRFFLIPRKLMGKKNFGG